MPVPGFPTDSRPTAGSRLEPEYRPVTDGGPSPEHRPAAGIGSSRGCHPADAGSERAYHPAADAGLEQAHHPVAGTGPVRGHRLGPGASPAPGKRPIADAELIPQSRSAAGAGLTPEGHPVTDAMSAAADERSTDTAGFVSGDRYVPGAGPGFESRPVLDADSDLENDTDRGGHGSSVRGRPASGRRTKRRSARQPAKRSEDMDEPGGVDRSGRPRRSRRFGVALAVLLSLVALLAAAGSGFLSWRTLETVKAIVPSPAAAIAPSATATERPRPPDPARYPVAYAKEPLRLDLVCAAVAHLDLDEPRAEAAENLADLRYESRCGSETPKLSLGAGAAAASRQVSGDTDAPGCDRAVRTSPLGRGLQTEVRKGTALCVLTAAVPAALVLVEIIDVGGSGTAGLRATSWQVPK